jgi:serine O-acetyltransferase
VTEDVPEGATMVGVKARSTLVAAETWAKDFIPYGTPCREPCSDAEPATERSLGRIEALEDEIAALKAQVADLLDQHAPRDGTKG